MNFELNKAMMKSIWLLLSIICILTSCIQIIRGNAYQYLSDDEKAGVHQLETFENLEQNYIYEITAEQLLKELTKHPKSLVYIFTSGCSSETCLPLKTIESYAEENELKLFLILTGYSRIQHTLQQDFTSQLFAVNASYYGDPNKSGYTAKFRVELGCADFYAANKRGGSYLFFEGNKLRDMKSYLLEE
jgi:hypothetical protein